MLLVLSALAFAVALALAWVGALGGLGGVLAALALAAAFAALLAGRRRLGAIGRRRADRAARVAFTLGGLVAVLRHPIPGPLGATPLHDALAANLALVDPVELAAWGAAAMAVKLVAVGVSAIGWYLALRGQGVRLPLWQTVFTGFLIGRFIGTFLPSTLGLDGYTLWEAGRVTGAWPRVVVAKMAEKILGATALFAGVLLTLPAAYIVFGAALGPDASVAATAILGAGAAAAVVAGLGAFIAPGVWAWAVRALAKPLPPRAREPVEKAIVAARAFRGQWALLGAVLLCKLVSHVLTAVVYWCTARAIGVAGAAFWPIVAGSLLQIAGTLLSPTVGGEGAREALQALLLTDFYDNDPSRAVLAASLGFVAAEAATLWGGVFLWTRTAAWRPTFATIDGEPVGPQAPAVADAASDAADLDGPTA